MNENPDTGDEIKFEPGEAERPPPFRIDYEKLAERLGAKEVIEEAVHRAATEHKEVPLVYYKGIQRVVIGVARITQDGIHAIIDAESKNDIADWLQQGELNQLSLGYRVPPFGGFDNVQFESPYDRTKKAEIMRKFDPPRMKPERLEATVEFHEPSPPLKDIDYEIRKDMGVDD